MTLPDGSAETLAADWMDGHARGSSLDDAKRLADAAARQWYTLPEDAERTPAPSVEECMRALDVSLGYQNSRLVDADLLRAFLSALPDEARRVAYDAVKGGARG